MSLQRAGLTHLRIIAEGGSIAEQKPRVPQATLRAAVPYGLVVRIPAFHAGGPGSIPGVGGVLKRFLAACAAPRGQAPLSVVGGAARARGASVGKQFACTWLEAGVALN